MTTQSTPVLLLSNRLEGGGVERHLKDLREGLAERGFRCIIAAACPSAEIAAGRNYLHLPLYRADGRSKSIGGLLRSLQRLHHLVRKEDLKLIHAHSRYAMFVAFLLRLMHPSLRPVYTAHTAFTDMRRFPFYPREVICVSQALAEMFAKYTAASSRRRLSVVHNGMALPPPRSSEADTWEHDMCSFLFVGRLVEQKGLHLLLDAAAQIKKSDRISIVIRGSGPLEQSVIEAAEASDGILRFDGYHPDPFDDTGAFDALLFPSLQLEGQPYVILEAYAHSMPVLSNDLPAIQELVKDRITGRVIHSQDADAWSAALREAAAHPGTLNRWGSAGRSVVEQQHRLDTMLEKIAVVYRRLLED